MHKPRLQKRMNGLNYLVDGILQMMPGGTFCKGPECRRRVWSHIGPNLIVRLEREQDRRRDMADLIDRHGEEYFGCCFPFDAAAADAAARLRRKTHLCSKDHITRTFYPEYRDHRPFRSLSSRKRQKK